MALNERLVAAGKPPVTLMPAPEELEGEAEGLDPNIWFNDVERIAAARIGRETVTYVSNIYKYYVT